MGKQKRLLIVSAVKLETMLAVDSKREQSDISEENLSDRFRRPIDDIEKTIEALRNAADTLDQTNVPVKILGIECAMSLFYSVGTIAFTVLLTVFSSSL